VKRIHLLVALGYLIVAAGASVSVVQAQGTPKIKFEKYTLPNGLEVILHEDHSTPIVAVDTWYHVGSGDEQVGRTGFAHLFEHIMFMGSQHVPVGAFDQMLEAAGADNNGSTTEDRTNYYETLPSNALPLALWLDSDRMGFLLPTMDLAKVNLQRDVVKNERRQRVDNQPYGRADEVILAALYPKSHPYSWPVIGSMTDLSAASLTDVQNFFKTYYAPNNATLAIAGDFNPDSVKKMVAQYFGSIPRGPTVKRRMTVPPVVIPRDTFLVLEDRVQLPRLFYTWHSVKGFAPDDAALDVLAQVVANDKNSRLYKKLVYEMQISQESSRSTSRQSRGRKSPISIASWSRRSTTSSRTVSPNGSCSVLRIFTRRAFSIASRVCLARRKFSTRTTTSSGTRTTYSRMPLATNA
jgi:zinc protease